MQAKVVDSGFLKKTYVYNSYGEAAAAQKDGRVLVELDGHEYQDLIQQIKALRVENANLTRDKAQMIQSAQSRDFELQTYKCRAEDRYKEMIKELGEQAADAERRRAGLYEAINRWKSKAQGKPLPSDGEITRVEWRTGSSDVLISQRLLKAPADPLLWKEAWSCLTEAEKEITERIFYDKHTWVRVYRQNW